MKKRHLLILASLLALALPATAGATTFGAYVGGVFNNQLRGQWSQAKVVSSLTALYKAGGRVARADSNWAQTEPKAPVKGRHQFDWGYADLVVSELASAHIRWEPTLAFAPRWAEGNRSTVIHTSSGKGTAYLPPVHNSDFAYYASAFMKRYGPNGEYWKDNPQLPKVPVTSVEVWNEPDNLYDWGQHPNLQKYAAMYEAVRTAVRHVYSRTKALSGGLAWTESSLPRLLKAFRGKPLDVVAIHPYGATPSQSVKVARQALADMSHYGRGKTPVSANEFGWTSTPHTWGSTKPKNVNNYVYQAMVGLGKLRIAELIPFSWGDASWGLTTGSYARAVKKLTH